MKYLLILLISFNVFAGSFIPKDLVGQSTDGLTFYSKKSKCEETYSKPCIDISGVGNAPYLEVRPESWAKQDAESCDSQLDCQSKLSSKLCQDNFHAIMNLDSMEVYCTRYRPERVSENATKKAEYDAEMLVKKAEKQAEDAEKQAAKACIQLIKNEGITTNCAKKALIQLIKDNYRD